MWYGFAALCVGLDVESRVVLLPDVWSCGLAVYVLGLWLHLLGVRLPEVVCKLDVCWSSIGMSTIDVNPTRDAIPVFTSLCGTAVLPYA